MHSAFNHSRALISALIVLQFSACTSNKPNDEELLKQVQQLIVSDDLVKFNVMSLETLKKENAWDEEGEHVLEVSYELVRKIYRKKEQLKLCETTKNPRVCTNYSNFWENSENPGDRTPVKQKIAFRKTEKGWAIAQ